MLIIKKDTWHYKVFKFSHGICGSEYKINHRNWSLCQYRRRILLAPFIITVVILAYVIIWIQILLIALFSLVLFGYFPKKAFFKNYDNSEEDNFTKLRVFNIRFMPAVWALVIGIIYTCCIYWTGYYSSENAGLVKKLYELVVFMFQIASVLFVIAILAGIYGCIKDSDTWKLIKASYRAMKEKICPPVQFED